ncbi:MAG TPA: cation:dicarboxylase symporter family transporter, partial [Alphaproteobacteria bacterium]
MPERALMNSSSLNRVGYGRAVLAALTGGDPVREEIVARAVRDEQRWADIKAGTTALTFPEMAHALRVLKLHGHEVSPDPVLKLKGPFSQKSFYEALRLNFSDTELLKKQLEKHREESKKHAGFLKTVFNIFGSEKPLEKVVEDIGAFAGYCAENKISFEEETGKFVTKESFLYKNRFLIAALSGGIAGGLGLDPAAASPALAAYPGLFFSQVLPAFVVPFTALSLFKTASREGAAKDSLLFARFAATMTMGAALSIAVINAEKTMGWIGDSTEHTITALLPGAESSAKSEGFNPAAYMLHGVAAGLAGGVAYGYARHRRRKGGELSLDDDNEFSPGKHLVRLSDFMGDQFNNVVTYGGIPAISLLLAGTIAEKGLGEFSNYKGLYATAFGTLALAQGMVLAGLYKSGFRTREDWKLVWDVATKAFSTSSGAATIDTIKDSLAKKGVSEKTRDLTPIATGFHMFGPTVCLGAIALYANAYFGHDQTLLEQAETLSLVIASMLAVRGVPTA